MASNVLFGVWVISSVRVVSLVYLGLVVLSGVPPRVWFVFIISWVCLADMANGYPPWGQSWCLGRLLGPFWSGGCFFVLSGLSSPPKGLFGYSYLSLGPRVWQSSLRFVRP